MKLSFITLVITSILSASAMANKISIDCTTAENVGGEKSPTRIQFVGEESRGGKISFPEVAPFSKDGEDRNYKVTPSHSGKYNYAEALDENGSIRNHKNSVEFFGDSDGFYLVYLVLYRDAGLKKGYLRYAKGASDIEGLAYSTVSCKVSREDR